MSKTNHVQLIGNLGTNPKLSTTGDNMMCLSVSMATHEVYKNQNGEKVQNTTWHRLVAFGKVANLINEYTKQGSKLMVHGRLQTRTYTSKEGKDNYITEIVVEDILFLDSKDKEQ